MLPRDTNNEKWNKDWDDLRYWQGDKRHFRPWYDEDADYNTNAKSYYDFLGFMIGHIDDMTEIINALLKRQIMTKETSTLTLIREGDWTKMKINNGHVTDYNPDETLSGNVKVSKKADNGISIETDGLYSNSNSNVITAFTKILQNLKNSGAWNQTGATIFDGDFNKGRDIATGNINLFGGAEDGGSMIRTNSGKSENDVTAGI